MAPLGKADDQARGIAGLRSRTGRAEDCQNAYNERIKSCMEKAQGFLIHPEMMEVCSPVR